MSFLNRTAPESHILPGMAEDYPMAQWNNGYTGAEGILANGGFELPQRHFKDLINREPINIPHRRGTKNVPGFLLPAMNLCIVQMHTMYYLKDITGQIIAQSADPRFEDGYRSKVLYFCYAAEIEQTAPLTPLVLSIKSTVAKEFKALLRRFRNEILTTVDKITGNKTPHYFFYIPIGSNGRVFFSDADTPYTIAPPVSYWSEAGADDEANLANIGEMAIPDYLYDHIISHGMDEAIAWRESLAANGNNGTPPPSISPAPEPPQPQTKDSQGEWAEYERGEQAPPPPPEPPMPQAQAVASAQAEAPLYPGEAETEFYKVITEAVKSGKFSVAKIGDYTQSVNEAGWPAVLAHLQKDIAAA